MSINAVFLAALLSLSLMFAFSQPVSAGEADIVNVKVTKLSNGFRFDVTVAHADTGWEHYADKWDVVTEDGTLLGSRTLYHPHVNEQPFTRSLTISKIPDGVTSVILRAHDSRHKYGGAEMRVSLP